MEDEDDDKELVADKNDDDDDEEDDDQEWDEGDKKIHLSFACEDCDYRWDDVIIKTRGGNLEDEEDEYEVACPMCGSMTVTQI
ncbi:MAG: hypothetical protein GY754_27760 [bacterium]|nr:hypothetical protein [bacterium]